MSFNPKETWCMKIAKVKKKINKWKIFWLRKRRLQGVKQIAADLNARAEAGLPSTGCLFPAPSVSARLGP